MCVTMILKIFSDCCICFAILASGPIAFTLPLLIPALICGVSAGIATFFEGKGWSFARRLCCPLPLCCLLLAENQQQMLLLLVPALYTGFVILRGKLELEYYNYRRFFLHSLALLGGAYLLVNMWLFLTQITSETSAQLDAGMILRYGLVHLFCGIVLQRQLRLGVDSRAEGGRRQIATLLGVAGAIVLGFVVAEPLLRQGIGVILKFALSLLMVPFVLLFELVTRLLAMLENKEAEEKTYGEFVQYWQDIMGIGAGSESDQIVERPPGNGIDFTTVWMIAAGIFVLIAAVLLFRSFHKRRAVGDPSETVSRVVTAPKKKKPSALSNRNRVRQLYREFLRVENGRGLKLKTNDTSADVLRRIHPGTDRPSADELRQVYLAARYDDRHNISRSQVDQAKKALKGTRQTKA